MTLQKAMRWSAAVRDLTGVGLLHCPSGLAVPSPAALRFLKILYEGNC